MEPVDKSPRTPIITGASTANRVEVLAPTKSVNNRRLLQVSVTDSKKPELVHSEEGISEYKLANGLRVILVPTEDTYINAKLIIGSGSLSDPKGKKGLAHLLEHLASSQASKNFEEYEFEDFTSATYGFDQATTFEQRTCYELELHSQFQDLLFERLQQILRPLQNLSEERLGQEKPIVLNELREAEFNSEAADLAANNLFWKDPDDPRNYPIIGQSGDLETISVKDLQDFSLDHYRPDNATLIMSGAFNANRTLETILESLGKIPNPDSEIPRPQLAEFKGKQRYKKTSIKTPHYNLLEMKFKIPGIDNGDMDSLEAIAFLLREKLNLEESSKDSLHDDFEEEEEDEAQVDCKIQISDYGKSGVFRILVDLPSDSPISKKDVENQIISLIKEFKRGAIDQASFNFFQEIQEEYTESLGNDPVLRKSFVANNELSTENWYTKLTRLRQRNINPKSIQAAAAKYLDSSNLTTTFHIRSPERAQIKKPEPISTEPPVINTEDIELRIPGALKDGRRVQDMQNDFSADLEENPDYNFVSIKDPSETKVILEFEKTGGERASPKDKRCLAYLAEVFFNHLMHQKPAEGLSLKHWSSKEKTHFDFVTSESHNSFSISSRNNTAAILELLDKMVNGSIFNNFTDRELENLLTRSKTKIHQECSEAELCPYHRAEASLRSIVLDGEPSLQIASANEIEQELQNITLDDVKNFFQAMNNLRGSSIALMGDFDSSTEAQIKTKLNELNKKNRAQSSAQIEKLEFQAIENGQSIRIGSKDRQTVNVSYGKSWNRSKDRKNEELILDLAKFLIKSKIYKAGRRNLSKLYDIKTSLATLAETNLGLTTISYEANKGEEDQIKGIVDQVLEIITKNGFSEEEIILAKTHLLFHEDCLRRDAKIIDPFRFLGDTDLDFEAYKSRLNTITKADIEEFTRQAVSPQAFSYVVAA